MAAIFYARNESALDLSKVAPGDFILTRSASYVGRAIRFGEHIRFHGSEWTKVNHAAGIINDKGDLVEMLAGGATASHLSKYTDNEYWHFRCPEPDKAPIAVDYWNWVLAHHTGYAWYNAASDGFVCLTGSKVVLGTEGRLICSGMVAAGYVRAGIAGTEDWTASPAFVFPTELGIRFG